MQIKKNSKQYKDNIAKQQILNLNGIKVKVDGSWGPWLLKQYERLTTKKKEYQATPLGFLTALIDKKTGNDTYTVLSAKIERDDRSKIGKTADHLLLHNDNPIGYAYQTIIPTAGVAATVTNPAVAVRTVAPAIATGIPVSYVANKISKSVSGKTTEELALSYVGNELSFLGNPGTYVGGKVGHNYKNLGRFVMDNVYPASYSGHGIDVVKAYAKALNPFSRIPTFYNGKRPKWYSRSSTINDLDFRLENMAEWAGVSEKEVPRVVTTANGDGTRGFKRTTGVDILPDADDVGVGKTVQDADFLFGVGGEHSDFTLKALAPQGNLWLYKDEQKLNPQYIITDKIKNRFGINKDTHPKINSFIDLFAGRDLKWLLGFDKDINYKQFLFEDGKSGKVYPIDWNSVSQLYK